MKKRFLAFLLAVCVAVSMLVLPASAVGSNAAVQTATALGGLTAEQAGSLGAPLTRGQAARLLTAFSAYRDTTTAQGRTGRLYSDVDSDSPYAVYIRTAVQNGWMTGYSDGSFRPDNTVTLEEACTMALRLLGYDSSPQLCKALKDCRVPVVVTGQRFADLPCVYNDDRAAARDLTRKMLEHGRKNIVYIGGSEQDAATGAARRQGVQDAARQAGLPKASVHSPVTS